MEKLGKKVHPAPYLGNRLASNRSSRGEINSLAKKDNTNLRGGVNILGIKISSLKKSEVLEKLIFFLSGERQCQIVTPNPEIILTALKDEELFYILNQADLAIPDGIGLKFAAWLTGKNIERITGADLVKDILKIAQK